MLVEYHPRTPIRRALRPGVLGTLAEADRAHLGERSDRTRATLPHGVYARNQRRADGAEADQHDAKFARSGRDSGLIRHCAELYHVEMT